MSNAFQPSSKCFRQARHEECLASSNEAILEGNKQHAYFGSRVEKLDRTMNASNGSKKVIDLAPTSRKDYWRSARFFSQLRQHTGTFNMVDNAECLNEGDSKSCEAPQQLRSRTFEALNLSLCYISTLPTELQEDIISVVIDGSNARMLSLMLVCRCWRDIIVNAPNFWRHLVLTKKTTLEQVDTWSQRAKGSLSTLCIAHGYSFFRRPKVFLDVVGSLWPKLDVLDIRGNLASTALPPDALQQLRLRRLSLNTAPRSREEGQTLRRLDGSHMRALTLRSTREISLSGLPFTELTFLEIRGDYSYKEAFDFIRRNPMLETLSLRNHRSTRLNFRDDDHDILELARLSRLRLCGYDSDINLQLLQMPSLKRLEITAAINGLGTRCIDILLRSKPIHLEELILDYCDFQAAGFISLLQELRSLRTLRLASCVTAASSSLITVLETLTKPVGNEGDPSSFFVCCPRLQHVDFSSMHELKAEPVILLVMSRLSSPPTSAYSQAEPSSLRTKSTIRPLPIASLNLEGCPLIDADALTWLQETVPEVRWTKG